ncbi:DUF3810 domain-containing protein [candidate division KSB1 bacterium]|nr:DUF3810 domain-containing protein [candidate division KSB1 bacterium]
MQSAKWLRHFKSMVGNHFVLALSILSALFLFVALSTFSRFPQLVEWLYARRVYALIARILSPLSAAIPFSVSEISLYIGLLGAVFWGIRGIVRRRFIRTVLELCAGAALLALWFYLAWGFNYLRPTIEQQLQLAAVAPDSLALRENFLWCIEQANATWQPASPWTLPDLDNEIERHYDEVFAELGWPCISGHWPPKFLIVPALLDYTLTSGIFGPFFHEVHLNSHLLPVEMPFVLAHEKAHGRGFARESEASFLAVLVCSRSSNQAVRYSAYFALLGRFMNRYRLFAGFDSLEHTIRPEIITDFEAVWRRYEKYMGPFAEISHKSYDLYLRANQVEGGAANYGDVVELVMRWRKSNNGLME